MILSYIYFLSRIGITKPSVNPFIQCKAKSFASLSLRLADLKLNILTELVFFQSVCKFPAGMTLLPHLAKVEKKNRKISNNKRVISLLIVFQR